MRDSTQPPKMSPLALVSAGMALIRTVSAPRGLSMSVIRCPSAGRLYRARKRPLFLPTQSPVAGHVASAPASAYMQADPAGADVPFNT